MNKTDFDNKLANFNNRVTSNKTKHYEVKKFFFLGRFNFATND